MMARVMITQNSSKRRPTRYLLTVGTLLLLAWFLLSPALVSAFAGLGGYISEKMLGDGINEAFHLGDGTNELIVVGSGPAISTLPVTDATPSGGVRATLRGNLTNLNGMPQADVWFVWGYDTAAMVNTTPVATVFATGDQVALITGFNDKREVFYQFRASTDGASLGNTRSFVADAGFSFLELLLPIVIALAIFVFVLAFSGSPLVAMFGAIIGLLAFAIVQAMLKVMR